MWDDYPKFKTYADFASDFTRCRSPEKGRPIKGWCRLFKEGDEYVVKQRSWRGAIPIFKVSRNNVITFVMPLENLLQHAQTIVSSLWRVVPIAIERKRKGVYSVGGINDPKMRYENRDEWCWSYIRNKGVEYFEGIAFDMISGECLNPQPNLLDRVIPEKRKQWLRDVKRFKKGLKIRAKMGALQGYIRTVEKAKTDMGSVWKYNETVPRWDDPEITQHVLECIRTEEYPPDLLKLLVQTTVLERGQREITDQLVLANVDSVFDKHSLHYRKAYGVFG